jgi:transposase
MGKLTRTNVGMDVCKRFIQVALLTPGGEWIEWQTRNESRAIAKMIGRIRREAGESEIRTCYEAGPTGYALQRVLRAAGLHCIVVAPSLIPRKPGERIKTDRRDARKLAQGLRNGDLTEVQPPTPEQESLRDLCRVREATQKDLECRRHRLSKFLLRRDRIYPGKVTWTRAHLTWIEQQRFTDEYATMTFDTLIRAVTEAQQMLADLDAKLEAAAQREPYATPVRHLRCFRSFDTVTALSVVAELYGFLRFESASGLMAYLGLVPSEHTTAGRHQRGEITKAGNGRVRRLLNQAAWNYRHVPRVSRALKARREGQPGWVVNVADKAMKRLHKRYWHLVNGGKPTPVAAIAVERELVGFVWDVLHRDAHEQLEREASTGKKAA